MCSDGWEAWAELGECAHLIEGLAAALGLPAEAETPVRVAKLIISEAVPLDTLTYEVRFEAAPLVGPWRFFPHHHNRPWVLIERTRHINVHTDRRRRH